MLEDNYKMFSNKKDNNLEPNMSRRSVSILKSSMNINRASKLNLGKIKTYDF